MSDTPASTLAARETPSVAERLKMGHCNENMGCGTMSLCVCAMASEAAEYIEELELRLSRVRAETVEEMGAVCDEAAKRFREEYHRYGSKDAIARCHAAEELSAAIYARALTQPPAEEKP